jgi:hypothetical protein
MQGIAAPWNPLKRIPARLSPGQNFFVGALSFGGSMCLFDLSDRYIRWRLYGSPFDQVTLVRFFSIIASCMFAGVLFGAIMMLTDGLWRKNRS